MKKTALVAALLALLSASSAEAIVIDVVPTNSVALLGEPVGIELRISGLGILAAPSVGGFDIDVIFDPSVLDFSSAAYGDPVFGDQLDLSFGALPSTTPGVGVVNLYEVSLAPALLLDFLQLDEFTMATVMFNTIGVGVSPIIPQVTSLADSSGLVDLERDVGSGSVTVNPAGQPVPEPASMVLLLTGLAGVALVRNRFSRKPLG